MLTDNIKQILVNQFIDDGKVTHLTIDEIDWEKEESIVTTIRTYDIAVALRIVTEAYEKNLVVKWNVINESEDN